MLGLQGNRRWLVSGLLATMVCALSVAVNAQEIAKPASAPTTLVKAPMATAAVIKTAAADAKKSGRNVLVDFTASWCGWCKLLDKTFHQTDVKPLIDKAFVWVHLDVLENGPQKALENPGGNEYLASMGGADSGIPYLVVLDGSGKKLADSKIMPKNQNVGCPATPEEIAAFGKFLEKNAPKLSAAERQTILDALTKNAPKQ